MSTSDSFFEMAKTVQDTYFSGNLQGRLYTLEMLKEHIEKEIKEVQDMINKTPSGKVLNNLTKSK